MVIEAILFCEIGLEQEEIRKMFYRRERNGMIIKFRELDNKILNEKLSQNHKRNS